MKMSLPNDLHYTEHASDIIAKAAGLVVTSQPFALVTSLEINGGAGREVGSLALVEKSGEMTGYLSNGCIDRDIQHHALTALQAGSKKLIQYGDGSHNIDLKLPCGGSLTVLIDPSPDTKAIQEAAASFAARKTVCLSFDGPEERPITRAFVYPPKHRLVLAGRGAIFCAMAQMGSSAGYEVHALSPNEDDLSFVAPFLNAEPTHLTSPNSIYPLEMLDAHSAFLTLFHDHDWEPNLLKAALKTSCVYVGSLGSRRTHKIRKKALQLMEVSEQDLARLRGPIGTVPSLRDASSISVSALAEIVAVFQKSDS